MVSVSPTCAALCARLGRYDSVVEIGIGRRQAVAAGLADRGIDVTATDVESRDVPPSIRFVCDDVFDPDLAVYRGTDAIYALNSPPELHHPIRAISRAVDAPFLFTTLGADAPAIPASTETLPSDTLFRATERGLSGSRSSSRNRRRSNPPVSSPSVGDGEGER